MGRGSSDQRAAASNERQIADRNTAIYNAERTAEKAPLSNFADAEMGSEGYSAGEKGDMTGSAMEATDAATNAAGQQMRNRAARTGSTGGMFANLRDLGIQRGQQKSDTARQLTQTFADEKQRRRMAGAQLKGNVYGVDTNLLSNVSGLGVNAVNAGNGAISGAVHVGPFGSFG